MPSDLKAYLTVVVAVTAGLRVTWFAQFAYLSLHREKQSGERRWWDKVKNDSRLPQALRGDAVAQHERYDLFKTHQVAAFTLGGLALTAWAVLAAKAPINDARRFALALLAVTILASIGTPVIFRMAGGELTRLGYEAGLGLASIALVAGILALALNTLDDDAIEGLAWILPALLLIREGFDVRQQMQLTQQVFEISSRRVGNT